MSKRIEVGNMIADLRYQLWPGVSTWGACCCGKGTARGGRKCAECIERDIDAVVGEGLASVLSQKMRGAMELQEDILSLAEDA